MFQNPGAKLRVYAKVLFILGVVLSVFLGGGFALTYSMLGATFSAIVCFVIVVAVGVLVSWLGVLSLLAIAQSAENTEEILKKL